MMIQEFQSDTRYFNNWLGVNITLKSFPIRPFNQIKYKRQSKELHLKIYDLDYKVGCGI